MKRLLFTICILTQYVFLFSQNDIQSIKDVFTNYKNAIMTDQEDKAIQYMDTRILEYYKLLTTRN